MERRVGVGQGSGDEQRTGHAEARLRAPRRAEEGRRFYGAAPFCEAWPAWLPRPIAIWLGLPWRDRGRWLRRKCGEVVLRSRRIATPDRAMLEQRVLPAYAADRALHSLLFVGCEWYTREYAALFEPAAERFRTIDIDAKKARHGNAGHIVAPLQEVAAHVAAASFDVVVCNGVYGFGVDTRAELKQALLAMHAVLRPGGTLLLGWNDVPVLAPFDPCELAVETGFERAAASPLGEWRTLTDTPTRHTFDFYVASPVDTARPARGREASHAGPALD